MHTNTHIGINLRPTTTVRSFHQGRALYQTKEKASTGSLFGEITKPTDRPDSVLNQISARVPENEGKKEGDESAPDAVEQTTDKDFKNDPEVLEYTEPKAETAPEMLLSPLKQQLYELSMQQGGYDPKKILTLDGKKYKLQLSKEELACLEPSLYLKSYRIKGSPKKATPFLRMLREMKLKDAITQCQFSSKSIGRDVGEMLLRGIKEAEKLGLDPNNLYLNQIWSGKDGYNVKRLDFKGRGRVGVIEHKWIHVRAILKPLESKDKFLQQRRARELRRPVKEQLSSRPIHEFPKSQNYKW